MLKKGWKNAHLLYSNNWAVCDQNRTSHKHAWSQLVQNCPKCWRLNGCEEGYFPRHFCYFDTMTWNCVASEAPPHPTISPPQSKVLSWGLRRVVCFHTEQDIASESCEESIWGVPLKITIKCEVWNFTSKLFIESPTIKELQNVLNMKCTNKLKEVF